MPFVNFPYGRESLQLNIPDERNAGILLAKSHEYIPLKTPFELVEDALIHPIDSLPLCELAKGKQKIVILASDHTRPVPSKIIAPLMLREIRKGNPDAKISFLIATGCHRDITREELVEKFGKSIVEKETIYVHNCDDKEMLVNLGTLPSGGELIINRLAVEADLLLAEGFIEPHFFAGFSGGRKSVLPGIASRKTVLYNHNATFIADPNARTGVLENNPIHADMLWAARQANLAFICNVVINSEKEVIYAVAGDVESAHRQGREFLKELCMVEKTPADIVITTNGGYPLDQNIYQSVKGMTAAEATVNKDGVIIMLAKANDGHGGESFYKTFKDCSDLNALLQQFIETPADKTVVDQWQSQIFVRVLLHATVIYVSDAPDEMIKDFHMTPAHSLQDAVQLADKILLKQGKTAGKILSIPDGVSVIVQ